MGIWLLCCYYSRSHLTDYRNDVLPPTQGEKAGTFDHEGNSEDPMAEHEVLCN